METDRVDGFVYANSQACVTHALEIYVSLGRFDAIGVGVSSG